MVSRITMLEESVKTATKRYSIKLFEKPQYNIVLEKPFSYAPLTVPKISEFSNGTAMEIAKDYFPDFNEQQLDAIIYGETGFPSFWSIPYDGNTPEECFRKQLLCAVARRHIRYSNLDIKEQDPYAGTINELTIKDTSCGDIKINLPNGCILTYDDRTGKISIDDSVVGKNIYNGRFVKPTKDVVVPSNMSKYVITSDVIEKFIVEDGAELSQEDFMEMPMKIFINWLIAAAAKEEETT